MTSKLRTLSFLLAAVLVLPQGGSATTFGTLSNFDVVNDTPEPCHGFEIELEDLHRDDVPYTFGGSYIRYGAPEVLDATVDPTHPRVLVRYRHWNGTRWEATPVAAANLTPSGHDCYAGGPVGNYAGSGCEHFGVSLRASPSRTTYRWLVAVSPEDVNSAFNAVPQPVNLPVPVWNVAPIPVAAGGGVNVRAEVEPVEEENHAQHGEPQWMKVFKVESELDLQPEDLVRLLLGVPGGIVPGETEIETEWKLIQSKPGDAEGEEEDAEVKEDPLDDGKQSVVRRYEFYRYTGPRDPENNEALPCIDDDQPVPPEAPVEGCSDLGAFTGAQNVAVDVDLTTTDAVLPAGEAGVPYPATALVVGGLPPYVVAVTGGALPDGMTLDPATGVLSGTPTVTGLFRFTIRAEDGATDVVEAAFELSVGGAGTPTDTPSATATEVETPTPSATATQTATVTDTATPTPTATTTETATPSSTPTRPPCAGDCDGGGSVAIDELVTLVNIALGTAAPEACPSGIPAGAPVDIALLVRSVRGALEGC